jgi:hypothetical protein
MEVPWYEVTCESGSPRGRYAGCFSSPATSWHGRGSLRGTPPSGETTTDKQQTCLSHEPRFTRPLPASPPRRLPHATCRHWAGRLAPKPASPSNAPKQCPRLALRSANGLSCCSAAYRRLPSLKPRMTRRLSTRALLHTQVPQRSMRPRPRLHLRCRRCGPLQDTRMRHVRIAQ